MLHIRYPYTFAPPMHDHHSIENGLHLSGIQSTSYRPDAGATTHTPVMIALCIRVCILAYTIVRVGRVGGWDQACMHVACPDCIDQHPDQHVNIMFSNLWCIEALHTNWHLVKCISCFCHSLTVSLQMLSSVAASALLALQL